MEIAISLCFLFSISFAASSLCFSIDIDSFGNTDEEGKIGIKLRERSRTFALGIV